MSQEERKADVILRVHMRARVPVVLSLGLRECMALLRQWRFEIKF